MANKSIVYAADKLTPMELKKINRARIYQYVYNTKQVSKQEIANALELSLPTVTQSLTYFIEQGLVEKGGVYASTGGRKAQTFLCNSLARVAIGVEVLKEGAEIAAVNLHGAILKEDSFSLHFENTDHYYQQLGHWINQFVEELSYPVKQILGVCVALQGLVSSDGETIIFSEILKSTGVKRTAYQKYISLPCFLIHDTEAAALAETWHKPDIVNAVYLTLNRNFGGTLIINGQVHKGRELNSGATIEHMCLSPNGPLCYCGKHGCIETYCSADSLRSTAQMELPEFFDRVHSNDPRCCKIWRSYLRYLSLAIDNIRMVVDCDFILGGFLLHFMNESDIELLCRYVKEQCAFDAASFTLKLSQYGNKSPKLGAAFSLIDSFFSKI